MYRRISQFVGILFTVSTICISTTYAASGPLVPTKGGYPSKPISIMVPSNPGGGWDLTGRSIQHSLTTEKIIPVAMEVVNKAGGGGTVALADFVARKDPHMLMITGYAMVTSIMTNKSRFTFKNVTPLARLTAEHEVIAVSAKSKYKDFKELIADFKKNPKSITWGGGAAGSLDHALVAMIAMAVGVNIKDVNYIAYSGGGETLPVLISNQVTVGISGYAEFKPHVDSGKLRFLAYSTDKRLPNDATPTLKEGGIDVEVSNWRGIVGAPGISAESKAWLIEMLTRMRTGKVWVDVCTKNGWEDTFLVGDAFSKFIDREMEINAKALKATGIVQ